MPQSLQCPRCNGSVSIADDAAGKRVKCPHCEKTFLAPGIAAVPSTEDDDDWLRLDDEGVASAPAPNPPVASPTPSTPSTSAANTQSPVSKTPPSALADDLPASVPDNAGLADESLPTPSGQDGSGFFGDTSLPEPLIPSAPPSALTPTAGPGLSEEEKALLGQYTEVEDFSADSALPPAKANPAGNTSQTLDAIRSLGAAIPAADAKRGNTRSNPPTTQAPAANSVEFESEFRVRCSICDSILYAKAADTGKTVKCSDCHSPVTIPRPPKVKKKTQVNLSEAETFALEQSQTGEKRADPFQKSAEQLLDEASRMDDEEETPNYDTPSVAEWMKNVFGIFKDPGVIVHWAGLVVLASIPAVIALKLESSILIMGLFPAGFLLGLLAVSCGFAILQSVANEEERVSEWPTLDPFAWLSQLFVAFAAAALAAIPVWALCTLAMGPHLFSVAVTMFSVYLLFPFILLSMLDMNSPFVPFSPEVARSVTKCEEAWGGFYFSSGIVFIALFLVFAMCSTFAPASGAVISIICGVGATFAYFGMLGRLAYSIGQAVNAPPMENDIDRSEKSSPT